MVCTCGLPDGCEDHSVTVKPRRLSGRCSSGSEGGGGTLFHAVAYRVALCGARPGRQSAGWSHDKGVKVTCTKCLRLMRDNECPDCQGKGCVECDGVEHRYV